MEGEADIRSNPVKDALDIIPEGIRQNEPFSSNEICSFKIREP